MAKQTYSTGQTLTSASMTTLQTNDYNMTVTTGTANYTLVVGDVGQRRVQNMASAGTVTVPNSVFTAGDALWIHSIGAGTQSIVAGAGLTLNSSAGSAPTLAQWEGGVVYFTSSSSAIFFRGGGTTYGVATGGTPSSITVGTQNYTLLTFTGDGTLTVTKAGLFDILCVGGGGGGGSYTGGGGCGGGGGGIAQQTVYLSANQTVTVGAGAAAADFEASRVATNSSVGATSIVHAAPGSQSFCASTGIAFGSAGSLSGSVGNATNSGANNAFGFKGGGAGGASSGGGGGGGAAAGSNGSGTTGGNGGTGFDASSFRGEAANTTLYAKGGGGGGSVTNGTPTGAGGANTGNGGGASGVTGNAGGSGIVLVRFKV